MIYFDWSGTDLETVCRAFGLIGFSIYVGAFFALSMGRLTSSQPLYFVLVLFASSFVLASLWVDFNLSAALIQSFYIVMSAGAVIVRWRRKRAVVAAAKFEHHPASVVPLSQGSVASRY